MNRLVSPLILINQVYKKQIYNISEVYKKLKYSDRNLVKITVKTENKRTVISISPHSKRKVRTKGIIDQINKVNKPALNRILQAYPFYIRVIGIINNKKLEILSKIDLMALPPLF